jgi:hypothetical protein
MVPGQHHKGGTPMRPFGLREGQFRVFYDVDDDAERVEAVVFDPQKEEILRWIP